MTYRLCTILIFFASGIMAQTPELIRFQASILDKEGMYVGNKDLTFRVSILQGDMRQRVFSEFHAAKTDDYGLATLLIGNGNAINGTLSSINWNQGPHYLRVEMDESAGTELILLSETQLMSVPYALHAKSVDNTDDADPDPVNELQMLSLEGSSLSISSGNTVVLPEEMDGDATNELQTLSLQGEQLSISNGNSITLPPAADTDPTNELQNLSLEGFVLSISEGNSIELPDEVDGDNTNELQQLSIEGNTVSISLGNSIELPLNNDNDATNEIQTLSLDGNILSLSGANSINLPTSNGGSGTVPDPGQPVPISYQGQLIYIHPTDNATSVTLGDFVASGATSIFDGFANTNALVNENAGSNAAQVCADLDAFGYEDWYLPARAELDAIFKQNYLITGYELDNYWTSTETSSNKGYQLNFDDGQFNDATKNQSARCRCVRKD